MHSQTISNYYYAINSGNFYELKRLYVNVKDKNFTTGQI